MKRLGKTANIIDEIAEYGNISDSIDVVLRGKKRKRTRTGRRILADLVGEEFLVVDFETNLVTKPQRRDYDDRVAQQRKELDYYTSHGITPPQGFVYPEQVPVPIGKYLISILRNVGMATECKVKAFTGDSENKSILDQMREKGLVRGKDDESADGKGVICSVKAVRCKGFNRYILC